jgi:hypothetical protein
MAQPGEKSQNPKAYLQHNGSNDAEHFHQVCLSATFLCEKQSTEIYSYPNQMYPGRYFSFSNPYGLIKHIGIGPGQQSHLSLHITSYATFGGEHKFHGK